MSTCLKVSAVCQGWDSNPRLHSETRTLATIQTVKEFHLESGALDRSAILTAQMPKVLKYSIDMIWSHSSFLRGNLAQIEIRNNMPYSRFLL